MMGTEDRGQGRVGKLLKQKGLSLGLAESCTGGLVGHLITNVAGSSAWFKGAVVAYSNDVKQGLLKVSAETLERFGAVSTETAEEMARGALKALGCDVAVSITGIAGPSGGVVDKPVGTVHIAVLDKRRVLVKQVRLEGGRQRIKERAAAEALGALEDFLLHTGP